MLKGGKMAQALLLFIWVFSIGCMKIVDKSKAPQDSKSSLYFHANSLPVRSYLSEQKGNVRMTLQSENKPGYYSLLFQFPEGRYQLLVQEPQVKAVEMTGSFHSLVVPHSKNFHIEIWQYRIGGPQLVASFRGRAPKDILVSTQVFLQKDESFEAFRVFFLEKALIKIGNHSLKVKAQEIIAESPLMIESYSKTDQAPQDHPGLDSGSVQFHATGIYGYFNFRLRGQKGGDGSPASTFSQRAKQGDPAIFGQVRIDPEGNANCVGRSSSNGSGAKGARGYPGKNGKSGGRGGVLSISSQKNQFLVYEYEIAGGESGSPSEGGVGQLGGLPGKTSGSGLQNAHCPAPLMVGKEGPQGEQGTIGEKEPGGTPGELCLNFDSNNTRCLAIVP